VTGTELALQIACAPAKKLKGKTNHISSHPQAHFGDISLYINVKQYIKLTM